MRGRQLFHTELDRLTSLALVLELTYWSKHGVVMPVEMSCGMK